MSLLNPETCVVDQAAITTDHLIVLAYWCFPFVVLDLFVAHRFFLLGFANKGRRISSPPITLGTLVVVLPEMMPMSEGV